MRSVILAAGEGKRAQEVTGSYLKCLFPILHPTNTLLGILLSQLHEAYLVDQVIVGGYRFEELETFLPHFFSRNNIYDDYVLVDARPLCSQGPIFSYLRAESECSPEDQHLLLPADTLFHPQFFHWLSSIDFSPYSDKTIHVMFTEKVGDISNKSQIITCDSNQEVSNIQSYKNWKKLPSSYSSTPKVMIPVMVLPGSFFPLARQGVEKGFTQVIQILIDLLSNSHESEWNIIGHQFIADSAVFQDFDVPEDIKKLKKMLD